MTDTKDCARCGTPFTKSRHDRTVNCPSCRGRTRQPEVQTGKTVCCPCGKTVKVDAFGHKTGNECPRGCETH